MKVILLENIKKIGKKYEVKEVSDGYARNFLIPKGLVKIADSKNIAWLEEERKGINERAEEEFKKSSETVSKLDGQEIDISVRVGDKGQLFKKIDSKDVISKLKEMGYEIDKKQLEMETIKELGEHNIIIKFDHNLQAEIKLNIIEE